METDAQRYKRIADDARNTMWALYLIAALLLIVTLGAAFPIAFVLLGIGQCVFGSRYAKYQKLAEDNGHKPTGFWEQPIDKMFK